MPANKIRHFRNTLYRTVLLPIGVILTATLVLWALTFHLFKMLDLAEHSAEIIVQTKVCEKLTLDLETGLRGYYMSNFNPTFLDPYNKAVQEIGPAFERLLSLVQDNPYQVDHVRKLMVAKDSWLNMADKTIRRPSPVAGTSQVEAEMILRKVEMDGIRELFNDVLNVERKLQQERNERVSFLKYILTIGGLLVALLTATCVGGYVWKQLQQLNLEHRKSLEEVLERNQEITNQREWFRVTLTSIGDAVIATDDEKRISFLNQEAEKLIGWTAQEALGKPVTQLIQLKNEETGAPLVNPVEEVLREKKNVLLAKDALLVSRHGIETPIQPSVSPIFGATEGHPLGVVLVLHDITTEREVKKALVDYSQRLKEEVAKKTEYLKISLMEMEAFSYTVSHDLRSPLRAMQGYAVAILEDQGERLNDDGRLYLERIKAAAERLDKLIQDLLTYTRVSRESTPLTPFDLDVLVRDMIEQYPNLHAPAVDVAIEGRLPVVLGRESALTQIFSNLLGNAVKFVAKGVVPRVRIWAEDQGERVRIWVEDNGIGIDAANYERAFRIFEQLNQSKLYTGTGVGLAITKKAVESLNGRVGIISELGRGARFWFELDKGEKVAP